MKRLYKLFSITACLLLFIAFTSTSFGQVNNLTHAGDGPYATIQLAIDNAATVSGDVLEVSDGTYSEDINVTKDHLTLQSLNGSTFTTIQLQTGVGINLQAGANNFTLGIAAKGFTILGGGATTFLTQLTNAPSDVTIQYNTFNTTGNASQGISVGAAGATNLTISNNSFIADAGDLVIWAPKVSSLTLTDNTITGPGSTAFQTDEISGTSLINGNTISGFTGAGGITFYGSASGTTTISNNIVSSSSAAILIGHPSALSDVLTGFTITRNTLTGNDKGLYVDSDAGIDADLFTVTYNDFSSNTTAGVDNQNAKTLTAINNWWGDPTGPGAGGGLQSNVTGNVTYSPFLLTPPVLASPADGAFGISLTPTLTYNAVTGSGGAITYAQQLSPEQSFADANLYKINNGAETTLSFSVPTGRLVNNTEYWWRVKATETGTLNGNAYTYESDWATRSFTTKLVTPVLTSPTNAQVGIELFPTLTWEASPGADTYRLQVNTASDFGAGTVIYDDNTLTGLSQQIAGLSNATEYFWKVSSANSAGNFSDTTGYYYSFTTSTDKYVTPTYPSNGDVVYTLEPNLTWTVSNSVSGLTYDYQISSTNSFTETSPTPVTGITTTNATTATLLGGTTYYWRARSKTSGGLYSQWSSVGTFSTQSGLLAAPTPTLSWPVGDPKLFDSTPTLYWFLSSVPPQGATLTYDIEVELVGTEFDGTPTYPGVGSSKVTYFTIPTALTAGASYHWQVRTLNDGVPGSWSSEGTFNINIGEGGSPTPILSWPVGGATVYSVTPTFYWYLGVATTGTITYDVQVYTDAGLTTLIGSTAGISAQSWTFVPTVATTPLLAGNTYYWKVTVHNSLGGTPASSSLNGSFVVASSMNSAPEPVLSYPIGGATVYSTKPALYWYLQGPPPTGATITYDIKVDNNSDFSTPEDTKLGNTAQFYTVVNSLLPGTYYWQVQTNNTTEGTSSGYLPATGTSANSFVVDASASGAGVAPTPLFPTGNAVVGSLTPTLSWIANGVVPSGATYDLELKPTSLAFDGTGLVTGITTNSTTTVTLAPGTAYSWRVRITHSSLVPNPSAWSVEALFTTSATAAPPPPMVGDPINGVMVPSTTPEISWFLPSAPRTALKYRLQIADDMAMNNIVVELDDLDAFSAVVNTLKGGATYYWRVQSKDAKGDYSAHSNSGWFSTPSITSVEDETIIPSEFEVSQNYPNPFNPTTTIRFALPEASFVTLRIYNMLGQEVKTLVNEQKNAGTFNVQWKGDNDYGQKVASGTYIYRVIAGANIFTKKMILLK